MGDGGAHGVDAGRRVIGGALADGLAGHPDLRAVPGARRAGRRRGALGPEVGEREEGGVLAGLRHAVEGAGDPRRPVVDRGGRRQAGGERGAPLPHPFERTGEDRVELGLPRRPPPGGSQPGLRRGGREGRGEVGERGETLLRRPAESAREHRLEPRPGLDAAGGKRQRRLLGDLAQHLVLLQRIVAPVGAGRELIEEGRHRVLLPRRRGGGEGGAAAQGRRLLRLVVEDDAGARRQ